jgi:histidyl-tRNA synthetase
LQMLLTEAGVKFHVTPETVRGLDYYTETVFEYESPDVPGLSLIGGGRYDNLMKQLGGPLTPCVGFGIGVERVLLALEAIGKKFDTSQPDVFVVCATSEAGALCRSLVRQLRCFGLTVLLDIDTRSMKSQMRQADSSGARFAMIIGSDEMASASVTIRNLQNGDQKSVPVRELEASPDRVFRNAP